MVHGLHLPVAEATTCMQVLPGLLHVIHMGHAQASYFALRTLFLLSGVDPSLLAQLAQPQNLVLLAQRAWHGKCEAQSVALLLLRDLARVHPSQVAAPECGIVTLLIGLQASPVPEVVQFAKETIEQLVHLTSVVDEQMEQVWHLGMIASVMLFALLGECVHHVPAR